LWLTDFFFPPVWGA